MSATYFKEYLTKQEERTLFSTVAGGASILARRDLAWMRALRYTGCRIEAFSCLNVSHALHVVKDYNLELEPAIMKRKKGHTVYVAKPGRRAFQQLLKIRKQMGFSLDPDAPLVLSRGGKRLSVRSYQNRMQHWDKKSGLNLGMSPHWWRHTLAKRIMKESESSDALLMVQAALGHTDPRSTMQYVWPDKEDMALELEQAA